MTETIDVEDLRSWVGRRIIRNHVIDAPPLVALNAILDRTALPVAGEPIPPEAHWLYFLDIAAQSTLAPDGHLGRGEFMPPVQLPRRMWAGVSFKVTAPICLGDAVKRTSEVRDVRVTQGKTGPLVFIRVRHRIAASDSVRVTELQDIVFRNIVELPAPNAPQSVPDTPWARTVDPDPVLLFRYSALTFNSHRIHYDQPYATEEEGYPGLLVQGSLIATLLLDLCHRFAPDRMVKSFTCKAERPIFCGRPFQLTGVPSEEEPVVDLIAWTPEGVPAFLARVDFFD